MRIVNDLRNASNESQERGLYIGLGRLQRRQSFHLHTTCIHLYILITLRAAFTFDKM